MLKNWIQKNTIGVSILKDFDEFLSSIHSFKVKKQIKNEVIPVAILDCVLYIKDRNKIHEYIINHRKDNIFFAIIRENNNIGGYEFYKY